jgi:hypothetical protein
MEMFAWQLLTVQRALGALLDLVASECVAELELAEELERKAEAE